MNARIVKKKNNYYIAIEYYINGKRSTESVSVRKELGLNRPAEYREAKALLHKIMDEHRQGIYIKSSAKLLKDLLNEWLDGHKYNLKPTTYQSYLDFLENHIIPELGKIPLSALRASHIEDFYSKKLQGGRADGKKGGLSARSVKYMHTIIRQALNRAVRDRLIHENVAKLVSPPKVEKPKVKYWEWNMAKAFLESCRFRKDRYYLYYLIALSTGMARGEILGLRWQDINWDKQTISIRQTNVSINGRPVIQQSAKTAGRARTLDVSQIVLDALKAHRKKQAAEILALGLKEHPGLVFTASTGNPLRPRDMDRILERAINRYNKPLKEDDVKLPMIGTHGLRHTYATRLLEEGTHPKVVSERLGHSSIRITLDTYSHVTPRLQKEVAQLTDDLV